MVEGTPILRRKLSQEVLEILLDSIHTGEYTRGMLLPSERHLMDLFKVGRPAVREALQDLQRMGLVSITHGEGARLTTPTAQSVLDQIATTVQHILAGSNQSLSYLKEARMFFEVGMVRMAAERATPLDIAALAKTIDDMEQSSSEFASFMRHDVAFHRKISEITANPIYVAVSEALLQWLSEYHASALRKVGREVQTVSEHRKILDRIAAHDADGAAAAMLAHQTRAADLYIHAIHK